MDDERLALIFAGEPYPLMKNGTGPDGRIDAEITNDARAIHLM